MPGPAHYPPRYLYTAEPINNPINNRRRDALACECLGARRGVAIGVLAYNG